MDDWVQGDRARDGHHRLILDDHQRLRRSFALLDDIDCADDEKLAPLWNQLGILLDVHTEAEERFFYPHVLKVGRGAGSKESPSAETEDAIQYHNDSRDAVAETSRHEPGSDSWWEALTTARKENSDHMGEEARQALVDFRRHTAVATRDELGAAFVVFKAQHADGVEPRDKEPEQYIPRGARTGSSRCRAVPGRAVVPVLRAWWMSTALEVEAYLYGALIPTPHDGDVIAAALNERFAELSGGHPIPYSDDQPTESIATEREPRPGSGTESLRAVSGMVLSIPGRADTCAEVRGPSREGVRASSLPAGACC